MKKRNKFSTLKKAIYTLWYYGFISEFEKDSFNMRIDTAKKQEKRTNESKRISNRRSKRVYKS